VINPLAIRTSSLAAIALGCADPLLSPAHCFFVNAAEQDDTRAAELGK
jgi:hypothetical protein